MKHFVLDLGPAGDWYDMEKTYDVEIDGQMITGVRVAMLDDSFTPAVHQNANKSVAKRLTGARLATIRQLTLSALESNYRDIPSGVHAAVTKALDAVIAAEVEVLRWRV